MPKTHINLPPIGIINQLLDYCSDTGEFRWRVRRNGMAPKGALAGSSSSDGYMRIQVNGRNYLSHRLAFYMAYGEDPGCLEVDHVDGDKGNNAIANLRLATRHQNTQNSRVQKNNRSGAKGVCWHRASGKYAAQVDAYGKRIYLGLFDTADEAAEVVRAARSNLHGMFSNHG